MADQNSQTQNTQTGKKQPDITGNRTRKEQPQAATSTDTDQNTGQTTEGGQPKFQSKHKDRAVQPPEKTSDSAADSQEGGAASQAAGGQTQNDQQVNQQVNQQGKPSGADSGQPADAGDQSSKLDTSQQSDSGGDGSVLPPESHLASLDKDKKGGNKQKSSSGKKKWLVITGVIILLLVLGMGGYGAYAQYVLPQEAPQSYMQRLSEMESGQYQLEVSSETDQADVDLTSEGEFSVDSDNPSDSQFAGSLDVEFGQSNVSFSIESDLRFVNGTGYVRLNDAQMLQAFIPALESNAWYSWDASSSTENMGMVAGPGCTKEDQQALREYFNNEATDMITFNNTQRQDWFGTQRDGNRVQHYSGEVSGSSIEEVMQGATEATSEECMSSEDINTEELDQTTLKYDLYTGDDWDELVVSEDSDETTVTLTTSNYGQEAEVAEPENATPIETLLQNGLGQGAGFDFNTNSSGTNFDSGGTPQNGTFTPSAPSAPSTQ